MLDMIGHLACALNLTPSCLKTCIKEVNQLEVCVGTSDLVDGARHAHMQTPENGDMYNSS